MFTAITAHLAYYAKAALHTFWQTAIAALLGTNLASMFGAGAMPSIAELEKIAMAAAVAGGAAVLSYVKQLMVLVPPGTAAAQD